MPIKHPVTPPPELVQQWRYAASNVPTSLATDPGGRRDYIDYIATQAARWGADMELEECISKISSHPGFEHPELFIEVLLNARRPELAKPIEQELEDIKRLVDLIPSRGAIAMSEPLRCALERLERLENQQNRQP